MLGGIGEKDGWIYVELKRPPEWKLPTFFPLVDRTFKDIQAVFDSNPRPILFDLSDLEIVDSTLISLLLQSARLMNNKKNAVIVSDPHVRDLMSMLGIEKLYEIYETIDEWRGMR
jgi:anti-anti-sigma factor